MVFTGLYKPFLCKELCVCVGLKCGMQLKPPQKSALPPKAPLQGFFPGSVEPVSPPDLFFIYFIQ